jgi:methionyl-tRNA formyltransferase
MDVGFAGTPAFAAEVLAFLLDAGFAVPLVLTQPDRARGRGQKPAPSPVKRLATERALAVAQPASLRGEATRAPLLAIPIDVLAVAAYGLILPPAVLAWPRHGCLNVHASLLPRWRGAAPIQRALLAGDGETGVTIMRMDAGLDTGPMLEVVRVPIGPRETSGTLERKLAAEGARALVAVLHRLAAGEPVPATPQLAAGAVYAAKIDKAEAAIDWRATAIAIDRQVRAFDPAPGAHTSLAGEPVKVWRAEPVALAWRDVRPGTVVVADARGIVVVCGEGAVRIEEMQPAGGRRMPAAAFAGGRRLEAGARFGGPTD